MNLRVPAKSTFKVLVFISLLLVVVHLIALYIFHTRFILDGTWQAHLIQAFNVDAEFSVPTWYSQILLFTASALLFFITFIKYQHKDKWHRYWFGLAAIMLYVSMDEGSALHEILSAPTGQILGIEQGLLFFAWIIPFMALVLVAVAVFCRFWLALPARTRWLFALSFGVFVAGAVGMEMLGARYATTHGWDYGYYVLSGFEEGLEMTGAALFIYSLLDYLKS